MQIPELDYIGPELGTGGQGTVYAHSNPRGAVKLYHDSDAVEVDGLLALADWRLSLPPADRRRIDQTTSWPHRVVRYQDRLGVTMPRAPTAFILKTNGTQTPRDLQWAYVRSARFSGQDLVGPLEAVAISYRYAQTLSVLHRNGAVYGDLSSTNLLWRSDGPQVAIFLLDCDAAWVRGEARALAPAQTSLFAEPWMSPSSFGELLRSDRYKMGVLFLRLYFKSMIEIEPGMRSLQLPVEPKITGSVRSLLGSALAKSVSRPDPSEWLTPLANLDRRLRNAA